MRHRPLSLRFVTSTLAVAFVLATSAGAVLVAGNRALVNMGEWVFHSHEVIRELNLLALHLKEGEASMVHLLLASDPERAANLATAQNQAQQALDRLHEQLAYSPSQLARLGPLQMRVQEHFAQWRNSVASGFESSPPPSPGERMEALHHGRLHLIDQAIGAIEQAQQAELQQQTRDALRQAAWNDHLGLAALGASLVLATGTTMVIFLRLRRLASILTVCSWTQRVKVGEDWVNFEEFLAREFGLVVTHGMSEDAARAFEAEHPQTPPPGDKKS